MNLTSLIERFSDTTEHRQKAIFSTLFIAGNRLQTLFDHRIPELSLKQFMLLSIVRQADGRLTLTQLGTLLGCSRQNIKKIADALERKGFIAIRPSANDTRASWICPTERAAAYFEHEFPAYQKELKHLFAVYSEDEITTLFTLLTKLYAGIDNLEQKTANQEACHE